MVVSCHVTRLLTSVRGSTWHAAVTTHATPPHPPALTRTLTPRSPTRGKHKTEKGPEFGGRSGGGEGTRRIREREGRGVGGSDEWKMRMSRVKKRTEEDKKQNYELQEGVGGRSQRVP